METPIDLWAIARAIAEKIPEDELRGWYCEEVRDHLKGCGDEEFEEYLRQAGFIDQEEGGGNE